MYTLNVKKRDNTIKAKKLRKMGMVTGNIRLDKENTNLLFAIPVSEAKKFMKEKTKGGLLKVVFDGQEYTTLVREILENPLTREILEISLQNLENGNMVTTVAHVILKNKNKLATLVNTEITEIPYKSLSENIVETAEIDLTKYKPGEKVILKDFAICNDPNVEILIENDTVVATVTKKAVS